MTSINFCSWQGFNRLPTPVRAAPIILGVTALVIGILSLKSFHTALELSSEGSTGLIGGGGLLFIGSLIVYAIASVKRKKAMHSADRLFRSNAVTQEPAVSADLLYQGRDPSRVARVSESQTIEEGVENVPETPTEQSRKSSFNFGIEGAPTDVKSSEDDPPVDKEELVQDVEEEEVILRDETQVVTFQALDHPAVANVLLNKDLLSLILGTIRDPLHLKWVRLVSKLWSQCTPIVSPSILEIKLQLPKYWTQLLKLKSYIKDGALEFIDDHTHRKTKIRNLVLVKKFDSDRNLKTVWIAPFYQNEQSKNPFMGGEKREVHLSTSAQGFNLKREVIEELQKKGKAVQKKWDLLEENFAITASQLEKLEDNQKPGN